MNTPPAHEFHLGAVVDLKPSLPCVASPRWFKPDSKWNFLSGGPILPRKWVAKMTQEAWFYIMGDFWGNLSRSFCIRRTIRARLFGCPVARLAQTWPKTFGINEKNGVILIFFWLLGKKKRVKNA